MKYIFNRLFYFRDIFIKLLLLIRNDGIHLDDNVVKEAMEKTGVQPWFFEGQKTITRRLHTWRLLNWIRKNISKDEKILETGTGIGINLFWLEERGFKNLYGFDLDEKAILTGQAIAREKGFRIDLFIDNGLKPEYANTKGQFDLIFGLNWIFLVEQFDLATYFSWCKTVLKPEGYLIIDTIDRSYDFVPNNQYSTNDWNKPVEQRKPSQYVKRYSYEEFTETAEKNGYEIIKHFDMTYNILPRRLYVLKIKN
jgi:2-polyprenyl-3-methyl-5-hydroxy-6-metoxy-1,4-benzoquinol methylase